MSLMINLEIDKIHEIVCSKSFISKIYLIQDKSTITNKGKKIVFRRPYTSHDLDKLEGVIHIPENISNIIENKLKNVNIVMETEQEIIKHTDKCIIVKYSSVLKEPEYINKIVGNIKIILYVQFQINKNNNKMCVVHFSKKLLNNGDIDDDSVIIDTSCNDIITNKYQQKDLKINENIINLTEQFLGHSMVHDIIIPTINNVYHSSFDAMQDIYISRFIKYMSKKNIDIYKKK